MTRRVPGLVDPKAKRTTAREKQAREPKEDKPLAWLAKEKKIDPDTPVRDYRLRDRLSDLPFLHTAAIAVLEVAGLRSWARHIEEWGAVQAVERLSLDGLLALWHPPVAN